jgi:uncharacterized protein
MSEASRLYELQVIDLEIDEKETRLAQIEASLGETEEVLQARAEAEAATTALAELESLSKDMELEMASAAEQLKEVDAHLYDGTVLSPRQLAAMEHDLRQHRNQLSKLEDQQLEYMEKLDQARATVQQKREVLAQTEVAWRESQGGFRDEIDQIQARLAGLRAGRAPIVNSVDAPTLATYEELRRTKRGTAVARVLQNTCLGCRITLPSVEVQKARLNPRLAFCSHCGRILWATR